MDRPGNPEKPPGRGSRKAPSVALRVALISGWIITVISVVTLLVAFAWPAYQNSKRRPAATKVVNDARILEVAVDQWAKEKAQEAAKINEGEGEKPPQVETLLAPTDSRLVR